MVASSFACSSESEPEEGKPATAAGASDTNEPQVAKDTSETTDMQSTKESKEGHLVIGNLIDTSGLHADFGEAHRKAAELAARHISEAGGTPAPRPIQHGLLKRPASSSAPKASRPSLARALATLPWLWPSR